MIDRDLDGPDVEREWFAQDGGMLIGRQAALADWSFRKEQKQFKKLVANLQARKQRKAKPELYRAIVAKSKARPEYKAAESKRRKLARLKAWQASVKELVCEECRETFRRKRNGKRPRFCSHLCRVNNGYQRRTPGARRIKRRVRARKSVEP